jgi:hypothetical protein
MAPVPAQITQAPPGDGSDDHEISYIADVDALSSTEAMLGCGDDNPY